MTSCRSTDCSRGYEIPPLVDDCEDEDVVAGPDVVVDTVGVSGDLAYGIDITCLAPGENVALCCRD